MEMAVTMVEARRRKQAAGGGNGSVTFSSDQLAAKTGAAV
jgi:hypothetical protein